MRTRGLERSAKQTSKVSAEFDPGLYRGGDESSRKEPNGACPELGIDAGYIG